MIHPLAYVETGVTIGAGSVIRQFASVTGGARLGVNCSVAPGCMLHGPVIGDRCRLAGGVMMGPGFKVGDDVFIGPNVTLCNDAWPRAHKDGFDPSAFDGDLWAVIVEDRASIGANAVVLPGVRIGVGAMIAAGEVVNCDVPPHHVYRGGVSRKIAMERDRMRFAV